MRWMAAASAIAVMGLCAGTVSAALSPIQVVRYVMTGATGRMPQELRCVSRQELLRGTGRHLDSRTRGVTIRTGRKFTVLLDWNDVCKPLHRLRTGRRVQPAEVVQALSTVLHEKAHVQGIRSEWQATCWGIPGVLDQLREWGWTAKQLAAVKWYLVFALDRARPDEYKLRGRCHVGAPTKPPLS
jgi:hypothetical protein